LAARAAWRRFKIPMNSPTSMWAWSARSSAWRRVELSGSPRKIGHIDALAFLSQHLVVLLDPDEIVPDMHEAYRRVRLKETAYGCFMMGPSATADVEATLVHGSRSPLFECILLVVGLVAR
jgi:hypothetical protein